MKNTVIYLIRHAKSEKNINQDDSFESSEVSQLKNENLALSDEGIKEAISYSKSKILEDIDYLYSSSYKRAIMTATYISKASNVNVIIDENFNERKLGNLLELKELGESKKYKFTTEQLLDGDLKNIDGQSRNETSKRFFSSFDKILESLYGKKIVTVSHGATIKFALLKWCNLNSENEIVYNGNVIISDKLEYPYVIKLTFDKLNLIDINKINICDSLT